MTNVTELLLACFVGNSLNIDVFLVLFFFFLLFYKKICLKECEVWQKVFSNEFIFTLTKQGLPSSFLSKFTIYFGRAGLLLVNFFLVSPATVPELTRRSFLRVSKVANANVANSNDSFRVELSCYTGFWIPSISEV